MVVLQCEYLSEVIFLLKLNIDKYNLTLVDVIIDSEYFASLCGFDYPLGEYVSYKGEGSIRLISKVTESSNGKERYGLMVWHNKNYIPLINFKESEETINISIENKPLLPYPAILRTEAWLEGLEYYLKEKPNHQTNKEVENKARMKFLEGIYTPQKV